MFQSNNLTPYILSKNNSYIISLCRRDFIESVETRKHLILYNQKRPLEIDAFFYAKIILEILKAILLDT